MHACQRFGAGHEYRRQQGPLAAFLAARGVPDLVAPYSLIRHKTGRVTSFAHWPDGPTLLPRVDLVILGNPGGLDSGPAVPWSTLREGGHLPDPEPLLAPPRWRVSARPDPATLASVDPTTHQPTESP